MSSDKLRRQIAYDAARMMYGRRESAYHRAKLEAARTVRRGGMKPWELPTNIEVRDQIAQLAHLNDGAATGPRPGDGPAAADAMAPDDAAPPRERFRAYRALLVPLETVRQERQSHPESDALYHSLQVFELARSQVPYDEEFLLAALLHDVGLAIDPYDHVGAAVEALRGLVTARTLWFIENLPAAQGIFDGSTGARARRRLARSEDYDDLVTLARCDLDGRVPGAVVVELDQALDDLRELARLCG